MVNATQYSHPVMRERRVYGIAASLFIRADILADKSTTRPAVIASDCFRAAEEFVKQADERMMKAVNKGIAIKQEVHP